MSVISKYVLRVDEIQKMARLNKMVPSEVVLELVDAYLDKQQNVPDGAPAPPTLLPLIFSREVIGPRYAGKSDMTLVGSPHVPFAGVHFRFERGSVQQFLVTSITVAGKELLVAGSRDDGISAVTIDGLALPFPTVVPGEQIGITLRNWGGSTVEAGAMLMGYVVDKT